MDRLLYNQRQQLPSAQSITNIQEGSGDNDMKEYTDKMMAHLQEEGMIDPVAFAFLEKAMRGKGVRSVGGAIRGQLGNVKDAVLGAIKEDESGAGAIIQKGLNLFNNGRRQAQEMGARGRGLFDNAAAAARAGQGRLAGAANELEASVRARTGRLAGAANELEANVRARTDNLRSLASSLGGRARTEAEKKAGELRVAAARAKAGLGDLPSSSAAAVEERVALPSVGELASSIDPRRIAEDQPKLGLGDSRRLEASARLIPNRINEPMNAEEARLAQQAQDDFDNGVMRRQSAGGGRQGRSLATFAEELGGEGEEDLAETFGKQPSASMISRLQALGQKVLKTKAGKELHAKFKSDTPEGTSDSIIDEMIKQAKGDQSSAGKRQMEAMASAIQDDPEAQGVLDRFSAKHPELVERLKKRRRNQAQLEGGADDTYEGELGHSGAKSFRSSPAERLARSGATQEEFSQSKSVVNKLPYNTNEAMEVRSGYLDYAKPTTKGATRSIAAETPDRIGALPEFYNEGADAKVGDFYLPPIPDDEFAGAEERGVDLGEEMKPMGRGSALAKSRGFGQSYAERQEALKGFGGFGSSLDKTAQQQADPNVGNAVSDLGVRPAAPVAPAPLEDEWGQEVEPKLDEFGEPIQPRVGFVGQEEAVEAPVINANLNAVPKVNPNQPYIDIAEGAPKDSDFGVPWRRPKQPLAEVKPKLTGEMAHSTENPFAGVSQADFDKLPLPKRATPADAPIPRPKQPAVGLESPEEVEARVAKRVGRRMDDDAPNIEDMPGTGETAGEGGGRFVVARPSADDSSRYAAAAEANNTPKPAITPDETPSDADADPLKSISSALTSTGEGIEGLGVEEDAASIPTLALPGVDVASLTGDIATAGLGAVAMGAGWLLGKVGDLAGDIKSRTATTLAPTLQLGKTISSYATQFGTEQ